MIRPAKPILFGYVAGGLLSAAAVSAQDSSPQPYINRLKQGLEPQPAATESFIESEKKKLEALPGGPEAGYSERLKRKLKELDAAPTGEPSFVETEKARLKAQEEGKDQSGAIAKFKEGRSDLVARREGEIHHAFGFRLGASMNRNITSVAGAALRDFSNVYGTGWAPDATLFYEFQPFHSEWFGNVGILLSGGLSFFRGMGAFEFPLFNQAANAPFPAESKTKLGFFSIPATVGLNYRFNLFRVLRPQIAAGPSLIGYMETRSDSKQGHRGYSTGLWMSAGVAILLDWMDSSNTWDLYAAHGIKHFYLTIDYCRQSTLRGDIRFGDSGIYSGLTFEY